VYNSNGDMTKQIRILQAVYLIVIALLLILIISTPFLISDGFSVFSEELTETVFILLLSIIGIIIYYFYNRELKKSREQLDSSLSYIGAVNVQMEQIESIFDSLKKYPENKNDLKYLFKSLADKALSIAGSDWVVFRVIELSSGKTLTEYKETCGDVVLDKYEISNKALIGGVGISNYTIFSSAQENFNLKVFAILPKDGLTDSQSVLIKSIVNNLGMLYLIFTSSYSKNSKENSKT